MHAVGTCSTGILAILFPTTQNISKDTAWNTRAKTLKTCIHVFTCILRVECTHTCTHTALDPTNKNTPLLSAHKTSDKII